MSVYVDAKGKFFTNVVQKDEMSVLIRLESGLVHGHVYVHPDQRLIDEMNGAARFIAVTDAEVFGPDGEVTSRAQFLSVNKSHIVWIRPDDEADAPEPEA